MKHQAIYLLFISFGLLQAGCSSPSASPSPPTDAELRLLFVGNSLTYTNDLPGLIAALAWADNMSIETSAETYPDFGLEDHLNRGDAADAITQGRWDIVVLQQGPSSLPESRANLLMYTTRFADLITPTGAKPALYMVWPASNRQGDFDGVSRSYTEAAEAVDGYLFPVGEAWRAAWQEDASLALYGPDGFHPSLLGTYLAAVVIFAQVSGRSPVGLPYAFDAGSRRVEIPPTTALTLQRAAQQAIERYGLPRASLE